MQRLQNGDKALENLPTIPTKSVCSGVVDFFVSQSHRVVLVFKSIVGAAASRVVTHHTSPQERTSRGDFDS